MQGTYTAHGITALSEALKVTTSLTSINLAGNELGVEGAKALVEGGAFMGSMTHLDVRANSLGEEGKTVLRKAVEGRSGFELQL